MFIYIVVDVDVNDDDDNVLSLVYLFFCYCYELVAIFTCIYKYECVYFMGHCILHVVYMNYENGKISIYIKSERERRKKRYEKKEYLPPILLNEQWKNTYNNNEFKLITIYLE